MGIVRSERVGQELHRKLERKGVIPLHLELATQKQVLSRKLSALDQLQIRKLQLGRETGLHGRLGHVEAKANLHIAQLGHPAERDVTGEGLPSEGILKSLGGGLCGPDGHFIIVESPGFGSFAEQKARAVAWKRCSDLDGNPFGRSAARTEHPLLGGEHDRRLIVDLQAGRTGDASYVV